jgi:hypothetical protein
MLPGGLTVDIDATEVIFTTSDNDRAIIDDQTGEVSVPEGRVFSLSVRLAMTKGYAEGVAGYQELLEKLGLAEDPSVAELEERIATIDTLDSIEKGATINVGSESLEFEGFGLGAGTSFIPQDTDEGFHPNLGVVWNPIPIP